MLFVFSGIKKKVKPGFDFSITLSAIPSAKIIVLYLAG